MIITTERGKERELKLFRSLEVAWICRRATSDGNVLDKP